MYAIVETGSKQYKVAKNDTIEVELLELGKAKEVKLDKVLFISDKKDATIGNPNDNTPGSHDLAFEALDAQPLPV